MSSSARPVLQVVAPDEGQKVPPCPEDLGAAGDNPPAQDRQLQVLQADARADSPPEGVHQGGFDDRPERLLGKHQEIFAKDGGDSYEAHR